MKNLFQNKKIMIISILSVVVLALVGSFIIFRNQGGEVEAADWFDEGYYYRKTIEIGNATSTLTDFQVKVLADVDLTTDIDNGKIQSDLDDLRFTDKDGNLLNHWIEDRLATTTVTAWVKIPTFINGTSTVYMYYGNPSAEDNQKPKEVFIYFEDFSTSAISWTAESSPSTNWDYSTGELVDTTISGDYSSYTIDDSNLTDFAVDVKWKYNGVSHGGLNFRGQTGAADAGYQWIIRPPSNVSRIQKRTPSQTYPIPEQSLGTTLVVDTWYNLSLKVGGTQINGYLDGSEVLSGDMSDTTYTSGKVGIQHFDGTNTFDDFRVRKYITSDPVVIVSASEEQGPGPVGYWSFDEGYGSTSYDDSPNNLDAAITNALWKPESDCKFGKCLYFDGTGDYTLITDNDLLDINEEISVSVWAKNIGSEQDRIAAHWGSGNNGWIIQKNTDGTITIYIGNDSGAESYSSESSTNIISGNEWMHIAFTFISGTLKIYINGIEEEFSIAQTALGSSSFNMHIGSGYTTSDYNFNGYIDEVKIYNYTRSSDQIKQDYNRGASVYFGDTADQGLSEGLVGYWKMDESVANSCTGGEDSCDSSGNNNHGTWQGSANVSTTAKFGRGVGFTDTTSDYVYVAQTDSISIIGDVTLSAWFYPEDLSPSRNLINNGLFRFYYRGDWAGDRLYFLYDITEAYAVGCSSWTEAGACTATDAFTVRNKWYHIAGIRKGDDLEFYLDGELVNRETVFDRSTPDVAGISNLTMGALDSALDDVRLYNRALSPEEVRRLYEWAPGPVAWYKLDEHAGTSNVEDSSGNDNQGTMNGSMTSDDWVDGKYGSGLDFDNSDDYISIADSATLADLPEGAFSFSAWIKNSTEENQEFVFTKGVGNDPGWTIYTDRYGRAYIIIDRATTDLYVGVNNGTYTTYNQWTHLALTYSGGDASSNVRIYFNGVEASTYIVNQDGVGAYVSDSGDEARIGRSSWNNYYDGSIDDVRIYNYERNARQILEDMNAGRKNNPIAYWSFDEEQGTTAYDEGITSTSTTGTSGYDGILTNMSTSGTSTAWTKYGKVGSALNFDGDDDRVIIGDVLDFDMENYSIGAWFKTSGSPSQNTLISKGTAYVIQVMDDNVGVYLRDDLGNNTTSYLDTLTNTSVEDGKWHYYTLIVDRDAGKMYGYLDSENKGEADISNLTSDISNSSDLLLGIYPSAHTFQGMIDEVKFYNYKLTLDEIRQNYNQGNQISLSKSREEVQDAVEGLVGWWKMDEDSWTGTSGEVIDYSGVGNHGTGNGSISTTSTAKYGRAGYFDGSDDYITVATDSSLQPNYGTIEAWIYPEAVDSQRVIYTHRGGGEATRMPYFQINNGELYAQLSDGTSYQSFYDDDTLQTNTWQHVVLSYGEYARFYINGVKTYEKKQDFLAVPTAGTWVIGGFDPPTASRHFQGMIDDVKIYNYTRSDEQIMSSYADGPPPVGYWDFDDLSGSTLVDKSGSGNNGTISGATWDDFGKKGGALSFDGVDDDVNFGSTDVTEVGTDNFSVTTWMYIKTPEFNDWDSFISVRGTGSPYWAFVTYPSDVLAFELSDGVDAVSSNFGVVPIGEWFHLAASVDRAGNTIGYLNGVQKDSEDTDTDITLSKGDPFEIMRNADVGSIFKFDDLKIFDYALTKRQVMQDYNDGKPLIYYKFDEGEGETAYDSSGNGNDGATIIGTSGSQTTTSTAWTNGTTGKLNGSINFDGTDDYILGGSNTGISGDAEFTISAWMKWTGSSWSSNYPSVLGINTSGSGTGLSMSVREGRPALDFWNNRYRADDALETNTWYHVVMTKTPGTITANSKIYVNGEEVEASLENADTAPNITNAEPVVGRLDATRWFEGQIDEVKFYNYSLTPEEVKEEYNSGFSSFFQ